ncbi:MAG TPA: hypothetical protein PK073_06290 [Ignavibacteriaceae bacterium]|jgi:hypothetical protein|nr:MAG: hypothetical protein BWY38_01426 [Ignavibacteria bacterium ADurb.Bin266]OQY72993.1 MAG: hypothetical protein B6D44_08750 [Ignavibacteriales bacterium UTCHB2]HQF42505.1 hypothetical protein [Ignavibacteriaceae bacterium]HQI40353.1 hypothetical protein [Ignavibacteriaceae bacterium]
MKAQRNFKSLLLISILLTSFASYAQLSEQANKKNQLYFELGGNGIIYSLNYERLLTESLTLRAGIGITPGMIFVEGTFIHIPLTVSYLIGGARSKFETGLGAVYLSGSDIKVFGLQAGELSAVALTGIIGYRYTSRGGFVLRVLFTPFYNSSAESKFFLSGGISFGFML